jgi:hypothetical protein
MWNIKLLCVFQYILISIICNIWIMVNKFKMDDSIHVKMLIVQKMWKNSLNHSSIIAKHWVACVSIYYNKCKMQLMSNGFKF